MRFRDRRVVVMGGSRGIGLAIAKGFAAEGASVAICARGAEGLEAARKEIGALGGAVFAAPCDLADAAQIASFVPEAAGALGGMDVLVNNASGFGMTDDETGWDASLRVDIMAIVRASQAAVAFLQADEGGSIINIASISGMRASTRSGPYAAAKAAVINYTASQAAKLARQNIRVNAISPGAIEFPGGVWDKRKHENPKLYETTLASIPFGRLGTAEEIADVALFLASPAARWITGQNIVVDGGQLLS
ncbi:SDR family oxidoreductase [Acidiphilium sp. PA]|uniref:SDR family NAD(P)-dependent oxidoreductase n=1 Tax=Acidiphilium sp. PA TaxID=2871705 RepID=UPI002244D807|nr:SDR family NAD(P)-dependent oxidoreductase [Acidiphilium sp. PA]MCW8307385.1 SDR family oxidoreductase [Acidiphilium sp. PA]